MEKRRLGSSSLTVSAIGLGCWGMSDAYGPADPSEALATLHAALDRGVDFLDTADIYGAGRNEELVSQVLRSRRGEAVIATKFGFVGDEHGRLSVDGRPEHVRAACDASLRRLGVEAIDLYYLHRIDPSRPIEETVGAMADLVRQGKIRHLGLSEVSAATLRRAHAVHPIAALQSEYSLWTRDPEASVLPACRELGVALVAFSPLGRGFLTGTVRSRQDLSNSDYRRSLPRFEEANLAANTRLLDTLAALAEARGATPAQIALAWLLAQGTEVVPLAGMKCRDHLADNLGALEVRLSADELARLGTLTAWVRGARYNPRNLGFIDS